jgi:hypothetical protein
VFLNNINYIIKNIYYFNLFKIKYIIFNNKFIFNLNLLNFFLKKEIKSLSFIKLLSLYKLNYKYKLNYLSIINYI